MPVGETIRKNTTNSYTSRVTQTVRFYIRHITSRIVAPRCATAVSTQVNSVSYLNE